MNKDRKEAGSAVLRVIVNKLTNKKLYFFTGAAHCFLRKRSDDKADGFYLANDDVMYSHCRKGDKRFISFEVPHWGVPSEYDGELTSGFDFAVGIIDTGHKSSKNEAYFDENNRK